MNREERDNSCEDIEEPWGTQSSNAKLRVGAHVRMPGSRFISAAATSWFVGKIARMRQQFWVRVFRVILVRHALHMFATA